MEESELVSSRRDKRVEKVIMVKGGYGWGGKKDCGDRARMRAYTGL